MTERLSSQYNQILEEFNRSVASIIETRENASSFRSESLHHLEQLQNLREKRLEEILREKGLAVCSQTHYGEGKTEEEKLGIFPEPQMTLHYTSEVVWAGSEYTEHRKRETKLELLCPIHFPKENTNLARPSQKPIEGKLDIFSEVVEEGGRLVTIVNSIDVTNLSVEKYYPEGVYQYLGLPKLPESPPFF